VDTTVVKVTPSIAIPIDPLDAIELKKAKALLPRLAVPACPRSSAVASMSVGTLRQLASHNLSIYSIKHPSSPAGIDEVMIIYYVVFK